MKSDVGRVERGRSCRRISSASSLPFTVHASVFSARAGRGGRDLRPAAAVKEQLSRKLSIPCAEDALEDGRVERGGDLAVEARASSCVPSKKNSRSTLPACPAIFSPGMSSRLPS